MFNSKKINGFVLTLALLGGTAAIAQSTLPQQPVPPQQQTQIEITDAEFEKFATAFEHVRDLTMGAQQDMAEAVQSEGLEIQKFNEIHEAHLNPETEITVTTEEKLKHQNILKKIEAIQVDIQGNMEEKIQEQGLSLERFEQIAMKLETDTALQQKMRDHFQN